MARQGVDGWYTIWADGGFEYTSNRRGNVVIRALEMRMLVHRTLSLAYRLKQLKLPTMPNAANRRPAVIG